MKITIIHRYFWPQNYPYATMLKDITEQAKKTFSEVEVISPTHSEEESQKRSNWGSQHGIKHREIRMTSERGMTIYKKLYSMMKYWCWIAFQLFNIKTDVLMVASTPPIFTTMLVRWFSKLKKIKYIYHCQDIHPESSLINGNIKKSLLSKLLQSIDKKNIDSAFLVITLSQDMKDTLIERGSSGTNIHCINNFIFDESPTHYDEKKSDVVRFLFAGTLGHFQNLENIFKVIHQFKNNNKVEFHIMGDGPLKNNLESRAIESKINNVYFYGMRPIEEATRAMSTFDFGIVSLQSGITKVAYPSKTIMYLSRGMPTLTCVDPNTELYEFINKNNLGIAVDCTDPANIEQGINDLIYRKSEFSTQRKYISRIAYQNFGRDKILSDFTCLFEKVIKS